MKLTVRYFAQLRELAGCGDEQLEMDGAGPCTAAEIISALSARHDEAFGEALRAENVRLAINQTLVGSDAAAVDGDEVAFLPPVTGG